MPTLEDAIALAVTAHCGQTDKNGAPYILHPLRVMLGCEGDLARTVAVLHDVVEDTGRSLDDLRQQGFTDDVLVPLDCVTRRKTETYEQFVERSASNPIARQVKLSDLRDNMDVRRLSTIEAKDAERLQRYLKAYHRLIQSP